MRLRNKKTGEIKKSVHISTFDGRDERYYGSIAELNEEWEDYKPKEPLIEDEKIRKAVRAWAEANKEKTCLCYNADENSLTDACRNEIAFNSMLNLEDCKEYSIAELCGEEEE